MDESVLKTTVERLGPTEQMVKGEVSWNEVKTKLDETFRELSREVSLKGFRKGKVPRSLMEKMFGKKVRTEVSTQLLREAISDSVKKHSIRVITPPAEWNIESEGIINEKPIEFKVKLEVLPVIEPKDYFGVEVEKREAKVSDEDVDKYIEYERVRLTQFEPVEDRTLIQRGDIVECDIIGKLENEPVSWADVRVTIPSSEESHATGTDEILPGLGETLAGKDTAVEDLDLELVFDESAPENYKGKTAKILVTFKGIKNKIVPKADDDFAKETGLADTFEEYREKVREMILKSNEEREKEDLKSRVIDAVGEKNEVELSPRLIEMEVSRMLNQYSSMGFKPEDMELAGSSFKDTIRETAKKEIQKALLIEAIAEKENIQVTDDDLEEHLARMAEYHGTNTSRLKADFESAGKLESVKIKIREDKTIDLLVSRSHAKSVKEPSDEEKAVQPGDEEQVETAGKKKPTAKKKAAESDSEKKVKAAGKKKPAAKKKAAESGGEKQAKTAEKKKSDPEKTETE